MFERNVIVGNHFEVVAAVDEQEMFESFIRNFTNFICNLPILPIH